MVRGPSFAFGGFLGSGVSSGRYSSENKMVCVCVSVCVNCLVVSDSDPMDCNPPGSSVHGISQGSVPVSHLRGRLFPVWATREDGALTKPRGAG